MSAVLIDSNLLLLLLVGWADPRYIASHRRLKDYGTDDFELVDRIVSDFDEIVTCPNVLTEIVNFSRRIDEPAKSHIAAAIRSFVEGAAELVVPSMSDVARAEFMYFGLTDSVVLQLPFDHPALGLTLLTADERLAARARILEHAVINYPERLRAGGWGTA